MEASEQRRQRRRPIEYTVEVVVTGNPEQQALAKKKAAAILRRWLSQPEIPPLPI